MDALIKRLSQLGLIRPTFDRGWTPTGKSSRLELLELCGAAALEGSLSVALDVRPDELIGPLARAMDGAAAELRVIDVRDKPRSEMTIRLGALEKTWPVASLKALVNHLNRLFEADPSARAVAILGEFDQALQLWALDKRLLGPLLQEDFFVPLNRKQLSTLAQTPTSC